MATYLMQTLQMHFDQQLEILETAASVVEYVSEVIEYFYALGVPIPFQVASDVLHGIFSLGADALRVDFTPDQYDAMLCEMFCIFREYQGWDWAQIILWRDWSNNNYLLTGDPGAWFFANQVTFLPADYLKRKALLGSLDPLATCQFCDCDDEVGDWQILFDYREGSHGATLIPWGGTYGRHTPSGWQTSLTYYVNNYHLIFEQEVWPCNAHTVEAYIFLPSYKGPFTLYFSDGTTGATGQTAASSTGWYAFTGENASKLLTKVRVMMGDKSTNGGVQQLRIRGTGAFPPGAIPYP